MKIEDRTLSTAFEREQERIRRVNRLLYDACRPLRILRMIA
ncbi:hypothetical protein [Caldichromatium japonicum]|nr:hypothetical protein [Caldichromatium japonicum]